MQLVVRVKMGLLYPRSLPRRSGGGRGDSFGGAGRLRCEDYLRIGNLGRVDGIVEGLRYGSQGNGGEEGGDLTDLSVGRNEDEQKQHNERNGKFFLKHVKPL